MCGGNVLTLHRYRRMKHQQRVGRVRALKNSIGLYTQTLPISVIKTNQLMLSSSVICQTTGPQPLPKRFLHLKRSRAFFFKWEYPLLSPRSSSNFLRLLPRLLVTSIRPFIFPSITSLRRQFLRKMWPIQLAFRILISCRIFLTFRICNTYCFSAAIMVTWTRLSVTVYTYIASLAFFYLLSVRILSAAQDFSEEVAETRVGL
jgi:hypothetical protein